MYHTHGHARNNDQIPTHIQSARPRHRVATARRKALPRGYGLPRGEKNRPDEAAACVAPTSTSLIQHPFPTVYSSFVNHKAGLVVGIDALHEQDPQKSLSEEEPDQVRSVVRKFHAALL